jgi:hypothetical protein
MKGIISALLITMLLSCSDVEIDEKSKQQIHQSSTENAEQASINKENSMFGLFGKKELKNYYISSPLQGQLVKDGKPMVNTKIIRKLRWNDNDEGIWDEIFTDENGYFDIPAHQEKLALSTMTEFVGSITLFAEQESEENCFWNSSKREAHNYSDIKKPLTGLTFDLSKEELAADIDLNTVLFRGSWDDMPEAY